MLVGMSVTTIKVDTQVRDRLAHVARARHTTMRALLADVASQLTRDQEWADIYAAYDRLKADPEEWSRYQSEVASWDGAADADADAAAEWPEYQGRGA